jgi:hypothetical protein
MAAACVVGVDDGWKRSVQRLDLRGEKIFFKVGMAFALTPALALATPFARQ